MRALVVTALVGTLAVAAALGAAGCETEPPSSSDLAMQARDLSVPSGPDMTALDLSAPLQFEDFVLTLINTQTSDSTSPTTIADKSFTDSMDPTKFDVLFP